jgi:hypothetical protein
MKNFIPAVLVFASTIVFQNIFPQNMESRAKESDLNGECRPMDANRADLRPWAFVRD